MNDNKPNRSLTVTWDDPAPTLAALATMDGRSWLQAILDGKLSAPPVAHLLGMEAESVDDDGVTFALQPHESHYNPLGTVHGGILSTIADTVMACSIHARLPLGTGYTTLDLAVNFVRPVTVKTGRILARGTVVHLGTRTATAECRITDEAGKLYAHGTTTCLLFAAT